MNPLTDNRTDEATYRQGLALLGQDKVAEGIDLLRQVSPRMPKALGDVAWAYRMRGNNDAAFACLEQYVQHFPDDPGGWALMARIERDRNAIAAAARYARRAAACNPRDSALWFELGEILVHARDWTGAAEAYGKSLKINPHNSLASLRRQQALRMKGPGRLERVARWKPIRWFLRRFLSSELVSDLIELEMGIPSEAGQWQMPLEWGEAAPFVESVPTGQEADQFVAHFAQCRCAFWQWFCALRETHKIAAPPKGEAWKTLELGSGPGRVAHHFALGGYEVHSLVMTQDGRAKRERRGIRAAVGDFHLIADRGGTYDLLVAAHALQCCRAPLMALWDWKRVLRSDGCLLVMARLAIQRPAANAASPGEEVNSPALGHLVHGVASHVMTLSYWQLRWLFRQAGFQLIAETLEDPASGSLAGVEHVDGRLSAEPTRAWNAFFVLRRPGRLPYDGALEKPRAIVR